MLDVVAKSTDLRIPEGGWTAREFAARGRSLMVTLHRVAVISQRKGVAKLAPIVHRTFRHQVERVIQKIQNLGKRLHTVDLLFPSNEALWASVIAEVLNESGEAVTIEVMPVAQSVMSQGYSRTAHFLAQTEARDIAVRITNASRRLAQRIANIDETTRRAFQRVLGEAVAQEMTVAETVRHLRARMNGISAGRAMTIARTELNTAWTEGTKLSFRENRAITEVSVIGCEAREPNSPQYRGESTCNIQGVPVADMDLLTFHPNHTGTIVPSAFRD